MARADAAEWLEDRLKPEQDGALREGALHLIFHIVGWQYFPPATQTRASAAIRAAGARATSTTPVAHLRREADGKPPIASPPVPHLP